MTGFDISSRAGRHLLPALCLLLMTSGCLCSFGGCGEGVNAGDVNAVSLDKEWQMGQQLSSRLAERLSLVQGAPRQYVQQVGESIVATTDFADRPWTFHLVADDQVNAFAIPGGHVYVNTGLVEAAAAPSELAGVMAHEVAHGTARHGTERLTKAYGIDAVLGLVTGGGNSGLIEQILTRVGQRGVFAKFSRDDEREADRLGLEYLRAAGYDPGGMVRFFETLLEQREERPNAFEQFFTSHPLTEERLQVARERLAADSTAASSASDAPPPAADVQRFRQVQRSLR